MCPVGAGDGNSKHTTPQRGVWTCVTVTFCHLTITKDSRMLELNEIWHTCCGVQQV